MLINRYENKGTQWLKSRPTLPVGLGPTECKSSQLVAAATVDTSTGDNLSKAAKKNLKRKEKKKQQKVCDEDDVVESIARVSLQQQQTTQQQQQQQTLSDDKKLELTRQVRSLRKKLKQIADLQSKLDAGVKLESEQLAKLERRKALEDEIEDLELALVDL